MSLSEGAQQIVDKYPWMQDIIAKKRQEREEEEWLRKELLKEAREIAKAWLYNNLSWNRIGAIKKVREYTGVSLTEARDFVESIQQEMIDSGEALSPEKLREREQYKKKINKAFPYK